MRVRTFTAIGKGLIAVLLLQDDYIILYGVLLFFPAINHIAPPPPLMYSTRVRCTAQRCTCIYYNIYECITASAAGNRSAGERAWTNIEVDVPFSNASYRNRGPTDQL